MSCVVGIDFSSFAIDLVKLDETANQATWTRVKLDGGNAWDRTRKLPRFMPKASWWDDVYLCAIEKPMHDQQRVLGRVQGSVIACIPPAIWTWEVNVAEWKKALGVPIREKPTPSHFAGFVLNGWATVAAVPWEQDAYDALGVALFARNLNQTAVDAA